MTAPTNEAKPSSYGSAGDWSRIMEGMGQGAGSAMQGAAANAGSKQEAKEAKRRTLTNILNQAMKRDRSLFRTKQEHGDEMRDYQSQALQEMARGFAKGSPKIGA